MGQCECGRVVVELLSKLQLLLHIKEWAARVHSQRYLFIVLVCKLYVYVYVI